MNNSADYTPLIPISEIRPGAMEQVTVEDQEYLVARVGEEFFVAENRCPHMGARLSEGSLEGTVVTCARHHSRFDLQDGRVLDWTDFKGAAAGVGKLFKRPRPLRVFDIKVEGGTLFVGPQKAAPRQQPSEG